MSSEIDTRIFKLDSEETRKLKLEIDGLRGRLRLARNNVEKATRDGAMFRNALKVAWLHAHGEATDAELYVALKTLPQWVACVFERPVEQACSPSCVVRTEDYQLRHIGCRGGSD